VNKGEWLGKVYAEASKKVKGNPELEQKMRDLVKELHEGKNKKLNAVWKKTRKWSLDEFSQIYKDFGVKYDRLYFESEVEKLGILAAKELLKKGIAEESEGAIIIDMKKQGLGVFVVLKQDGMPLYSSKDLGLIKLKTKEYKFDRSYHVVGSEQNFYFRQLIKTFGLMGLPQAKKSKHISYELVMLEEGKMGSREGNVITYSELLEKVTGKTKKEVSKRHKGWSGKKIDAVSKSIALAAIKFGMLSRENQKKIIFNWQRATELDGETGPYVQYSYARARSILRKAKTIPKKADYGLLTEDLEKGLVTALADFTQILEQSAEHCSPHLLAHYLLRTASAFNSFYQKVHVLNAEDKELRAARLGLVKASTIVLENGLILLGIDALEEM
ncbi:MAG: arginine--tRNA ligase, partial [Candidatus Diapherotrites archaeon]